MNLLVKDRQSALSEKFGAPLGELVPVVEQGPAEPQTARGRRERARQWNMIGIVTFVIPVVVAAIYLFLIASDRYVAEARFLVRTTSGGAMEGLSSVFGTGGQISRATDETYAIIEYVTSRDVASKLARESGLRDIMARPEADFINRFPNLFGRNSEENFYRTYVRMVDAEVDTMSGLGVLKVTAFRAEDAQMLAGAVLKNAESLVNRLNERSYADSLRLANIELEASKANFLAVESKLMSFRAQSGVVDPGKEALANLGLVGRLQLELSKLEAGLSETLVLTPGSPSIIPQRERAGALRQQIEKLRSAVVGADGSMSDMLSAFESLSLDREIATRRVGSAELSLIKARSDAERQHLYLQTVVEPNRADHPLYPRRLIWMGATILLAGIVYMVARSFASTTRSHAGA